MTYRQDSEWLDKVELWHKANGLPLPDTFPKRDKPVRVYVAIASNGVIEGVFTDLAKAQAAAARLGRVSHEPVIT